MDTSLLASKLRAPPQPHGLVHRDRLVDTLERAAADHKIVLLSAAAGYGKTTLLAQWARVSGMRIAWLSLDAEDNEPRRFFRYLLEAWRAVQSGIDESPFGLLLGASEPDLDAVLTAFLNAANDRPEPLVFVLDDVHVVDDPDIDAALTFLLDHLPPQLHFVLAGRAQPSLPLARYRARRELLEFRGEDLQFSVDECAELLNRLLEIGLTHDEIVPLHARLEGWVAGLQLAALTLRRDSGVVDRLVISGRHRFIADYLSQDVLAHLPDDVERFLLQISILDRLTDSLCDAVTGRDDSQDLLERLERENLFLAPLDASREWFRFHRLFADFLRDELHRRLPHEVRDLHRRAARWWVGRDRPEEAFPHAVAGDDLDLAVEIFDRHATAKLQGGELRVVQRWLDALPAAWYAAYPVFDLARAGLLAFSGALDACMRCVDDVEQRLAHAGGDDAQSQLAKVTALRCAIACMQNDLPRAEAFANRALRDLPEEDVGFRPLICGALGDSYRQHGRWAEARAWYREALGFSHAPLVRVESAHVYGALADLALRQGQLGEAADHWRQALVAIQDRENWGRVPLPVIGWVYLRVGELHYERNDLADAWVHLCRGLERAELGGDVRALIAGRLLACRVKLAEDDVEAAADFLEEARPLVAQASFPEWTSRYERRQLELWLRQGKRRAAIAWAEAMLDDGALAARPESEASRLGIAWLLIGHGDGPARERAHTILQSLLQSAEAEGRMGIQIEALALQALARWQGGDRAGAMTALERALRLAEPEGYIRLFVDLGPPMGRLLQEAHSRAVMPEYVARLLAVIGADLTGAVPAMAGLPEHLTAREQEVLGLMAAGLTNREIAEAMFISPETVKKHTGNIYAKLSVGHRTEAVARARVLGILDAPR